MKKDWKLNSYHNHYSNIVCNAPVPRTIADRAGVAAVLGKATAGIATHHQEPWAIRLDQPRKKTIVQPFFCK